MTFLFFVQKKPKIVKIKLPVAIKIKLILTIVRFNFISVSKFIRILT